MPTLHAVLQTLARQAHGDGGWGYAPTLSMHPEPTCLALLALSLEADGYRDAIDHGLAALQRCGARDGAYRLPDGREEAVWPTALVLFVQSVLNRSEEDRRRTANELLGLQGWVVEADPEMAQTSDIDTRIPGWPWAENNFSWVEPTAWACVALRRAGHGEDSRVANGQRLLLDRAFEDGGVNYGNKRIFGQSTLPIPGPTALMLIALQGRDDDPLVGAAIDYLRRHAGESEDLEHLGWARLALDLFPRGEPSLPEIDRRIEQVYAKRLQETWTKPSPLREALTALALADRTANPFRLPPQAIVRVESADPRTTRLHISKRRSLRTAFKSAFRAGLAETYNRLLPPAKTTTVHIARVGDYDGDLADAVKRQYEHFRETVPLAGKRVVLKPNLVEYRHGKAINTHPHVIAAAIELCRREGAAEVLVAEGPGHWRNVEYLVRASGLGDVLRHYKVPFVDLNHDEPVKKPNVGWLMRVDHLYLARTIATAEVLISMPKLKTHHWAGATLSLKNLFGTLPGTCYGWPKNELHWRGIDNSVVDIALTRNADLAIVDGIVGMEGDGPLNGTARPAGVILMGSDLVAVDATCCRIMQLDPQQIGYLTLGAKRKLGVLDEGLIQQVGEAIDVVHQPFETIEQFSRLRLVTGSRAVGNDPEPAVGAGL